MKLMLFLGSGVSYASKLPDVYTITHSICSEEWVRHSSEVYYPKSSGAGSVDDPTPVVQRFLKLLKSYADGYYAVRTGQEANYEDLFYLARQVADDRSGTIDNPAIRGFADEIKSRSEELVQQVTASPTKDKFTGLAELACQMISGVVRYKLAQVVEIKGFQLIEALANAPWVERLDIVTLNHDLLIEGFLKQKQLEFSDGFEAPTEKVRYFNSGLFESETKIRVFKLHGSINWYRFRPQSGDWLSDRYGIPTNGDPWHCKDGAGKLIDVLGEPIFLTGTYNKILHYGYGIFAEIHFWFHRLLKEHDTIAMSGYGWNDLGISGRLLEWLHFPTDRKLVLMYEKPEETVAPKKGMWHRYHELLELGRLIPVGKWMKDLTLNDIAGYLNSGA